MAYIAKDGKAFGNRETGRHYDRTRPGASSAGGGAKASASKPSNPTSESHADDGPQHEVVSEHGPATHTHIHGPDKSGDGTHHVHSFHEDGHHHVSKGHDVESAHEHSQHMMGGESAEHEASETPEFEAGEQEGAKEAAIPGMSS